MHVVDVAQFGGCDAGCVGHDSNDVNATTITSFGAMMSRKTSYGLSEDDESEQQLGEVALKCDRRLLRRTITDHESLACSDVAAEAVTRPPCLMRRDCPERWMNATW